MSDKLIKISKVKTNQKRKLKARPETVCAPKVIKRLHDLEGDKKKTTY